MRAKLLSPDGGLDDVGKLLVRVVVGGLLLYQGVGAFQNGNGHVMNGLADYGLPGVLVRGVYVGAVLAALLILLGTWTRMAAMYAGSVAFAALLVQGGDFVRFEPTGAWIAALWVFYIIAPLGVFLLGPGRFALRPAPIPWD
jgi:putative oxidoreductase